MSKALAYEARIDAAGADTAGLGSAGGTPNTQLVNPVVPARRFGRTTAIAQTVALPITIPPGHSATIRVTMTSRVVTPAGAAAVGDVNSVFGVFAVTNPVGSPTPVVVPAVTGTPFRSADASRAADTLTLGLALNTVFLTYTQETDNSTIDTTIETETQFN
jgi:hypothetical protein